MSSPLQCKQLDGADEIVLSAGASFGVVAVRLSFGVGAGGEGPTGGLTSLAIDMLDRGTLRRNRGALNEALDQLGAAFDVQVTRTSTSIDLRVLEDDLDAALDLLLEIVSEPLDDAEELRRLRHEVSEDIENELDEPGGVVSRLLSRTMWPTDDWGRPIDGTRLDRARVRTASLVRRRREVFGSAMVVGVAADDPARHEARVRAFVDAFRSVYDRHGRPAPHGPEPEWGRTWARGHSGVQGAVIVAASGPSVHDPSWLACVVHNAAFGSGFSSPLVRRIRGEEGLSYGVNFALYPGPRRALHMFEIQPESDKVAYAIAAAFETWERFAQARVEEAVLEDVREYLIGSHLIALETVRRRMSAAVGYRIHGRDVRDLDTFAERVRALSADAVTEASTRYGWGLVSPIIVAALDQGALDAGWARHLPSRRIEDAGDLAIR